MSIQLANTYSMAYLCLFLEKLTVNTNVYSKKSLRDKTGSTSEMMSGRESGSKIRTGELSVNNEQRDDIRNTSKTGEISQLPAGDGRDTGSLSPSSVQR